MAREIDYVLEGLTEQELKDTIIKNVSEINQVKEDAKIYAKGAREAIKSLDERISDCLELVALKRSERAA
jgi:hypothetical protein